ncbi:uncharacterized protein LOC128740100 [Sabethes cyaneus]|uniref:uncharacterized protein LOC128740100 n=1 Tax=Sabethes cyaneus TaxID=53552 RepID=UPI00237D8123|nr:uncharacterized protein LOC128740100 [Sabethes cyaneus]
MSPAHLMLGRDIKSSLELMKPKCNEMKQAPAELRTAVSNILKKQELQRMHYGGTRKVLFQEGDRVVVRDYSNPNKAAWVPAIVRAVSGKRNYRVQLLETGRFIKRHLNQMRRDSRSYQLMDEDSTTVIPQANRSVCDLAPVKRTFSNVATINDDLNNSLASSTNETENESFVSVENLTRDMSRLS